MKADPRLCSMEGCDLPLGPDALEFTHQGEPSGGICGLCLAKAPAIRVVLTKSESGILEPTELTRINQIV